MKKIIILLICICTASVMSAQTLYEIKYESDSVAYDSIFDSHIYFQNINGVNEIIYQVPTSLEKYYRSGEVQLGIGASVLSVGSVLSIIGIVNYFYDKHYGNTRSVFTDICLFTGGTCLTIGIPLTISGCERKKHADIIYNNLLW